MMMRVFVFLAAIVLGTVVGPVSALWASGLVGVERPMSFADVEINGWLSDWAVGSEAADPYLRARIARHGLLAMRKEGAVYFARNTDDSGRLLTDNCRYRLSGGDQKAYWWSITLYDEDSMLPLNDDDALSFDASDVPDGGPWEAMIASTQPTDRANWVSSRAAGNFDLTLRLYRPDKQVLIDPEATLNPPSVVRISCEDER
ncbi:MAG: DUF1214 domain-containing protein [Pseudomonadota bacterium]